MSESNANAVVIEGRSRKSPIDTVLLWAVIFGLLTLVCLVLYGMLTGVFREQPPRTLGESVLSASAQAIKQNPGSGNAWAQYARALYISGQKAQGWDALAQGRKKVKDDTVVWLNCQEVDMLIRDGKNEEALKKSKEYQNQGLKLLSARKAKEAKKGVNTPLVAEDNEPTIRMFLLSATAESNLKKYKDAVIDLNNALVLDPMAADVVAMRGWAKMEAGDLKGAKADFEKAKFILPEDPQVVAGLAELAKRQKSK